MDSERMGSKMFDILIKNATVITLDAQHRVFQHGYIAVIGDSIAEIGPMESMPRRVETKKTIDAEGLAVMPGLIDGHGHAGHCLIKTFAEQNDTANPPGWWGSMAEDIYYHYTDDFFWYAEGALAAAERLKFGITTGVSMLGSTPRPDRLENLASHFEGARKTGLRQISGIGSCDGPWPKKPWVWQNDRHQEYEFTPEQMVENTEKAVMTLNGKHKRQICIVAPGSMGINEDKGDTREFCIWKNKQMGRIAKEYNVPLHTHIYGGGVQFIYDTTPELLGPTTSLTHATGLSENEIKILAETGAVLFHGPTTRANIKNRCPVYEVLRAGGEVVIVTDGTAPDRSYDIWRDMKVFQVIHRAHENDPLLAPPGRVLEMCTIRAARALGIDKMTGSLEIGKRADIIIINTKQPHLAPFGIMPVQRLVYHAQGQDVDTVIVDGEIMMENRKMLACDEKQILTDAEQAFHELCNRLGSEKVNAITAYGDIYGIMATPTKNPYDL
ncbi:MAG TPA: amidohydrolase family protein [Bacillota bacterium]|nr:amidohydrolase family protein [Bacillota bacterium]